MKMDYIVMDFEFNQSFDFKTGSKAPSDPLCPLEIIQIGAVRLGSGLDVIGSFSTLVCPRLYRGLNPFVARVTGLSRRALQNAPGFRAAYGGLLNFIGKGEITLCFWGNDDIKELFRNILFYNQSHRRLPKRFINVQRLVALHMDMPAKHQISLKQAAEMLEVESDLPFHNAANDAYYTAKIFAKTFDDEKILVQNFDIKNLIKHNTELVVGVQ